jgi:xanthine dehydrogenase YagR molybdenum-binding subunit
VGRDELTLYETTQWVIGARDTVAETLGIPEEKIPITGVAAAVANAVYHATGTRIRDLPITPDKLLRT